jgi:hypothetical protein
MSDWNDIYVTDKSGNKFFKITASPMSTFPELRNIKRTMQHCASIDQETAVIMLNGEPYGQWDQSDDELLAQLGL